MCYRVNPLVRFVLLEMRVKQDEFQKKLLNCTIFFHQFQVVPSSPIALMICVIMGKTYTVLMPIADVHQAVPHIGEIKICQLMNKIYII